MNMPKRWPHPARSLYAIQARSSIDLPVTILVFKTALDLDMIRGLRRRLKEVMGGKSIRRLSPG